MIGQGSSKLLDESLRHGRVANAISQMLRSRLDVPHIYFEPEFPGVFDLDVMAVDGFGGGDVHAVRIAAEPLLPWPERVLDLARNLKTLPFHYKWLAIQAEQDTISTVSQL